MAASEISHKPKDQQLKELLAAAAHDYAHKSYDKASDLYAQAAEIQDELNGEMNPANAELLYAYGRCLHHLAVSNSDVLGGKVAGEGASSKKKSGKKRKRGDDAGEGSSSAARGAVATDAVTPGSEDMLAEKIVEKAVENKDGMQVVEEEKKAKEESKPFFQISGDDDEWEDEDEEEEGDDAAADEEAEEEEDDFATAFEVLDVARVLLTRQIEEYQASKDQLADTDAAATDYLKKQIWTARDRLADTHDLQAEISLENERFAEAVADSRASLALKKKLFDQTHGQVSEAHFKLSLALELGSVTTPKGQDGMPIEGATPQVDQSMRDEAAKEMEAAIQSTKLRSEKETAAMKGLSGEELKKKQAQKQDVEDMIAEMEQRLDDLRNQPVSLNTASGPAGAALDGNALGSILGEMLGESPEAFKARITEASRGANDLTGMIKHKKPKPEPQTSAGVNGDTKGKGKRRADTEGSEDELAGDSKRVKSPAV